MCVGAMCGRYASSLFRFLDFSLQTSSFDSSKFWTLEAFSLGLAGFERTGFCSAEAVATVLVAGVYVMIVVFVVHAQFE